MNNMNNWVPTITSLTLPIDAIDIIAGADLVVRVDFPLRSFL